MATTVSPTRRRGPCVTQHGIASGDQFGNEPAVTHVLTEDVLAHALATVGRWLDRVFSPLVTLWVFLGQVLSADHSCRAGHGPGTVAKALADLTKAGELLNPQDRRGYRLPGGPGGGTPQACSTDPVVPAAPRDRCTTPSQSDPGRWLPSTRAGTLILRVHRGSDMVPIQLDGVPVYGVVSADSVGLRVRVSVDEFEQLGLLPGRQVRLESPGHAGTFLLTTSDYAPPFAFLRLLPLASRAAG